MAVLRAWALIVVCALAGAARALIGLAFFIPSAAISIAFLGVALCKGWGGKITVLTVVAVGLPGALNAIGTRDSIGYAVTRRALFSIIALTLVRDDTPTSVDMTLPKKTLAIVTAAAFVWRTASAIIGDALVILGTRPIVPLIIDARPIKAVLIRSCGA